MSDTHVPSSLVELEITETALMKNLEQTIPLMQRFKDIGIRLAIDDFGTGYSVLNTLRHFPIDVLKIDQAFIQGLPQDNTCRVICESIIHLCKGMNFEVVAEGVETEQQQNFLSKYQGLQAQGYYFSKPISVDAFSEILSKTLLEPETTN